MTCGTLGRCAPRSGTCPSDKTQPHDGQAEGGEEGGDVVSVVGLRHHVLVAVWAEDLLWLHHKQRRRVPPKLLRLVLPCAALGAAALAEE